MAIGTDDVIRVTARLKYLVANDVQNVFYIKPASVGAETQAALRLDLATWMETIYDGLIGMLMPDMTFDNIELFNVTDNAPEPSAPWPTLTVGTVTGDATPEGVAALMLGRTAVSKVLGKKYIGVIGKDIMTDGLLEAASLALMATAGASWITPFTAASGVTWDPGIWSSFVGLFRPFIEADVSNIPAYQRRRKRGVGS